MLLKLDFKVLTTTLFVIGVILLLFAYQAHNTEMNHDALNCNTSGIVEKFGVAEDKAQCPKLRVAADELLLGNPRKDGIPAIDNPKFTSVSNAPYTDDELIIGVEINGDARAYPYSILNWHEIVNDTVGGIPIAVTYCPLCETNTVFIRKLNNKETTFGTSGALYNSCLVMYDRATESLWVQPWGLSIYGEHHNDQLERVPGIRTTLGAWTKKYPNSKILTTDTGYSRDYMAYPYGTFYTDTEILFPARNQHLRQGHPKDIIFIAFSEDAGDSFNNFAGASTSVALRDLRKKKEVTQVLGNTIILFQYDESLDTVTAQTLDGKEVPLMAAFNFVLPAFFEKF